jgi:hypothetical protein
VVTRGSTPEPPRLGSQTRVIAFGDPFPLFANSMMGEPEGGTGIESSSLATQATWPATMIWAESGKSPPHDRLGRARPAPAVSLAEGRGASEPAAVRGTRRETSVVPGGTLRIDDG